MLTLKSQIKDSMRKIDAYGDPDDEDLQYLYDKLDTTLTLLIASWTTRSRGRSTRDNYPVVNL